MANVLFTTYCNRNCSYCFAKEKVVLGRDRGDASKNMSIEALGHVIEFYRRNMLRRFVILGGEPTLHPNFNQMIDLVSSESFLKSISIFTNGLMPKNTLAYLVINPDPRIRIALNLNSPDNHTKSQMSSVEKTMETLGPKIGLGVNIYMAGQEYDYLIDAIEQYNLSRHVRVGLTQPIPGFKNVYAMEEDIPAIAVDILEFAEKFYKKNISFSFDCGFRFCMFSLDQHKELLRMGINFKSVCSPIIDIGPDLSVWRCFPLNSNICGLLTDFTSKNEIVDFYEKEYKSFIPMGNMPECPECRYRVNSLCSGGCLSRTLMSFQR